MFNEDKLIEELLETLCYFADAELMLGAYASDMAEAVCGGLCSGSEPYPYYDTLIEEIKHLGQAILMHFVVLQAYRQGYLFYQFERWWGQDMVVADFSRL